MMKKLNNIKWNNKILYHGTTKNSWELVKNEGFRITKKEKNWLGRGIYFGVDNILTPMKYAFDNVKDKEDDIPIILKIDAESLKKEYLNKVLDLTNHNGIIYFYLISIMFKKFTDELNKEDRTINNYRNKFENSFIYSDVIKKVFTLDMEWYSFLQNIQPIIDNFKNFKSPLVQEIIDHCSLNISNLIIDWFNYFISGGQENEIPIRGVMANFNTGEPIIIPKLILKETGDVNRIFYDYISLLNRTELAIFGFNYYQAYNENVRWNFNDIFINNYIDDKIIELSGEVAIKNYLIKMIECLKFPDLNLDSRIEDIATELIRRVKIQVDKL